MNLIIVRNGIVVWEGATIADALVFMTSIKGNLSENDKIFLYKKDKSATINTTIIYS